MGFKMKKIEIQKWGSSAAILLNEEIMQQLSCEIGSKFEVTMQDGGVFLKPVSASEHTLDKLLERCTKENTKLNDEDKACLNAKSVGKEV